MEQGQKHWNWTRVHRAGAILCVLLVLLTGFLAAVHVHAGPSGTPDHSCSVCALAHAGMISIELGPPSPVFARSGLSEAVAAPSHSLVLVSSQYIRPPPVI